MKLLVRLWAWLFGHTHRPYGIWEFRESGDVTYYVGVCECGADIIADEALTGGASHWVAVVPSHPNEFYKYPEPKDTKS